MTQLPTNSHSSSIHSVKPWTQVKKYALSSVMSARHLAVSCTRAFSVNSEQQRYRVAVYLGSVFIFLEGDKEFLFLAHSLTGNIFTRESHRDQFLVLFYFCCI